MKPFKVNRNTYQVPTSWSDINLKKFIDIRKHESRVNELDPLDYSLEYISIVTDIPVAELEFLTPIQYDTILKELLAITKDDIKEISDPIITINGVTYVMDKNLSDIPLGQFIDLDLILKDKDLWEVSNKLTASFLRKAELPKSSKIKNKIFNTKLKLSDYKISEYSYEEMNKASEIFLNELPMPYIYSCVIFFLIFAKSLHDNMKVSSPVLEEVTI